MCIRDRPQSSAVSCTPGKYQSQDSKQAQYRPQPILRWSYNFDNELRDTSSLKADELTLDASIPAEIDSSFDQSNNEVFKADEESPKDTSINDWQKLHRVGPREHNPNMFCQRCETYGHTRDRCQFSQAIDGLTEHLARTIEPGEPNNTNNGQNHESEDHEDENIFKIDVDSDDAQDTDAHGNTINPTDNAYDGDDDIYDGEYTITSGSTEATEASTSHNWSPPRREQHRTSL